MRVLSDVMEIQLVVSEAGNAAIFYRGDLGAEYSWAQYDEEMNVFQMITEEGEMDVLGHKLTPSMIQSLKATNEIFLFKLRQDKSLSDVGLIKYAHAGGY